MINNQDYLHRIYNIKQVSLLLNENLSTIRYWLKRFPLLNFKQSDSGRRLFYFEDILTLLNIQYCLNDQSLKIEGVQKYIKRIGLKAFKEQARTNYKYKTIIDNMQNNVLINGNLKEDFHENLQENLTNKNSLNLTHAEQNKYNILQMNTNTNSQYNSGNLGANSEELLNIMKEIEDLEELFKK